MKETRNYGIDFLRISAMLMVCLLHVLRMGGILTSATPLSVQYEVAWFLETAAYCAVNCYALVSGYVGVNSSFRLSRIVVLWLQVVFYSVGCYILKMMLVPGSLSLATIAKAFLPVTSELYWYFSAYFCAFFFFPLINWIIHNVPQKLLCFSVWGSVILFSILPTLRHGKLFGLADGYSALWILVLYFWGGYIRVYDPFKKCSKMLAFGIFGASVTFSWAWRWGMEILGLARKDMFCNYVAITIVIAAIALLTAYSKMKIPMWANGLIKFISPLTFGVYIIHTHPIVLPIILSGNLSEIAHAAPIKMVAIVLGMTLAIFGGCAIIDAVRAYLFKILRINEVINKIGVLKKVHP